MIAPGWTNPFEQPGAWRRANLHTHTTASDGKVSLQERVNEYDVQGYDILAVTDHHAITGLDGLRDPEALLVLSGAELHPGNPFGGATYHFICLGIREQIDAKRAAHPQEVIDAVNAQGGLVFLAHPYWCRHTMNDLAPLRNYAGVEVYNYNCHCEGRADSTQIWDEMLTRGPALPAIACDDCHDAATAAVDTFGAWTWVRTASLTPAAVLSALKTGHSYSSCGPEIKKIEISDALSDKKKPVGGPAKTHKIRVTTSKAHEILFVSDLSGARVAAPDGRSVTEGEFLVRPGARFVRIEVVDRSSRRAWSNPIPFIW